MTTKHRTLIALACAAALSLASGLAQAGPAPLKYELKPYTAAAAVESAGGARVVESAGAPWIRLIFTDVKLAPGSKLRITSLEDGAVQHLDAKSIRHWRNTSAYFNGSAVRVELLPGRGARGDRYSIAQLMVGPQGGAQTESQCGGSDDRVASNLPERARLLDVGCTANLMANGCFITAGHCMSSPSLVDVIEFNVPASSSTGGLRHPAPKDQYVPTANRQFVDGGLGKDWGVFTVSPNSETGLTPLQAQGSALTLATTPPAVGATAEIVGYGVDSGAANQTQQVHSGPITSVNTTSNRIEYKLDTEGGNSGSAVLSGGVVSAIHTNGGCTTSNTGANSGTLYTNPQFQSAFAAVCAGGGVPAPSCADIGRVRGRCTAGTISLTFTLKDATHDGQSLTASIDGIPFDLPIVGTTATLSAPGFNSGAHTVTLVEPASCGPARTITCP